jgi:hypothetical protein
MDTLIYGLFIDININLSHLFINVTIDISA